MKKIKILFGVLAFAAASMMTTACNDDLSDLEVTPVDETSEGVNNGNTGGGGDNPPPGGGG